MDDEDAELLRAGHARIGAQRIAIGWLASIICQNPGLRESFIDGLRDFEENARKHNAPDAHIAELREIREFVAAGSVSASA
jgi:hypothetical protein